MIRQKRTSELGGPPCLSVSQLRVVAEVVAELAKRRGKALDRVATGSALARAALVDPAFKARLIDISSTARGVT